MSASFEVLYRKKLLHKNKITNKLNKVLKYFDLKALK